jgi:hypothetical protein
MTDEREFSSAVAANVFWLPPTRGLAQRIVDCRTWLTISSAKW